LGEGRRRKKKKKEKSGRKGWEKQRVVLTRDLRLNEGMREKLRRERWELSWVEVKWRRDWLWGWWLDLEGRDKNYLEDLLEWARNERLSLDNLEMRIGLIIRFEPRVWRVDPRLLCLSQGVHDCSTHQQWMSNQAAAKPRWPQCRLQTILTARVVGW
jgi:hypothetical protein